MWLNAHFHNPEICVRCSFINHIVHVTESPTEQCFRETLLPAGNKGQMTASGQVILEDVSLTCRSRSLLHLHALILGTGKKWVCYRFLKLNEQPWRECCPICLWSGDFVSDFMYVYSKKIRT